MNVETATPTPPKLHKDSATGYSNLERQLQSDQEFRADIEQWLKAVPNYSDRSLGYSNLAAMKDDALQPEVFRQRRAGYI